MEEGSFRFTGIDVNKLGDKIEVSMNNYSNSLENKIDIRDSKPEEVLTKEEINIFRAKVGKLSC